MDAAPPAFPAAIPAETRARMNAARLTPEGFAAEQEALGRCWSFVGFTDWVAEPNDWFRATLGGKSIIVQRFEQGLSGFENKCAHRQFPLRHEERGNGPLVCGFHHWRYNHEGLALGIPECPAQFGKTPRELNARLNRVELATVGRLIFARFHDENGPNLEAWLGPALPILKQVSTFCEKQIGQIECVVNSHWRAIMEISLDDYHIVAVHPQTFGNHGYIPADQAYYERLGAHSMYFRGGNANSLPEMVQHCEAGTFFPPRYRILQLFPMTVVTFAHTLKHLGDDYWYVILLQIIPEAHNRTRTVSRLFPIPHPPTTQAWRRFARWLAWPTVNAIFRFFTRKVHLEDNQACEKLQEAARLDDPAPLYALHETRVAWFEEVYARILLGQKP
jgi:phenylpropionate dioxygenase-like ring-hydroxylating dioxygenase large terminal subunit